VSRPPLTRTALWVRERACVPLVLAEARGTTVRRAAQVTELASARRQPGRRSRRRRAA